MRKKFGHAAKKRKSKEAAATADDACKRKPSNCNRRSEVLQY
jgi:hypothetical protein